MGGFPLGLLENDSDYFLNCLLTFGYARPERSEANADRSNNIIAISCNDVTHLFKY